MVVFPSRTTNTLPAAVATSSCVSAEDPVLTSSAAASRSAAARANGSPSGSVEPTTLPLSSNTTAVWICDETSVRSASACCASMRLQSRVRPVRVRRRDLWGKFYADRGTHLAAMIAYFALLSFVPLTFLALSLLGLTGRADESSFLVKEIKHTLPGTPIDRIIGLVHTVQDNAAALGIVGGAGDPARGALREGHRHRVRRGAQLVALAETRAGADAGTTRPGVTARARRVRDASSGISTRRRARRRCALRLPG